MPLASEQSPEPNRPAVTFLCRFPLRLLLPSLDERSPERQQCDQVRDLRRPTLELPNVGIETTGRLVGPALGFQQQCRVASLRETNEGLLNEVGCILAPGLPSRVPVEIRCTAVVEALESRWITPSEPLETETKRIFAVPFHRPRRPAETLRRG